MSKPKKSASIFFVAFVVILFASFSINFFGVNNSKWFSGYQADSDSLVLNLLSCPSNSIRSSWLKKTSTIDTDNISPKCNTNVVNYYSQIGLQGKTFIAEYKLAKILGVGIGGYIFLLKIQTALLSALVLALFCLWVLKRHGKLASIIVVFLVANSVWIVGYSKSLYWALPVLFLPFLVTLVGFEYVRSNKHFAYLMLALFCLFGLKFANGYEYTTTIIISSLAALAYQAVIYKYKLKRFIIYSLGILMVGFLAFIVTLFMHISILANQGTGYKNATSIVKSRVLERTTEGGSFKRYAYGNLEVTTPDIKPIISYYLPVDTYQNTVPKLQTEFILLANYILLPVVSSPIQLKPLFEAYILSFISLVILFFILSRNTIKAIINKKFKNNVDTAIFVGGVFGLAGAGSWYIMAHGHAYVHAHINGITYYLPFALFAYLLIAVKIAPYIRKFVRLVNDKRAK